MLRNLRRRQFHAWILLGVFLPMLMIASVHVHTQYEDLSLSCTDCVHHVHHDGHIAASTLSLDHCVLCHFLAFHYLEATPFVATFFAAMLITSLCFMGHRLFNTQQRVRVPRGPPEALFLFA